MRVDKFLNSVNITKRRAIAQDMLANKVVAINGVVVKPAKEVKVGDTVTLTFLDYVKNYKVLAIPKTKTIPKTAQDQYVKELS